MRKPQSNDTATLRQFTRTSHLRIQAYSMPSSNNANLHKLLCGLYRYVVGWRADF